MKVMHSGWSIFLTLVLACASQAQTASKAVDSSRQPPSPLKIPDSDEPWREIVSAKNDTFPIHPDSGTAIPDSIAVLRDTVPAPGEIPGEQTVVAPRALETETMPASPAGTPGDSDGDGVPDANDRCSGTPHGLSVDKSGCLIMTQLSRRLVLHVTYFPGTTRPDPYTLQILDDLIVRLKDSADLKVTVEGFTDNIGEDSANLVVSRKRADKIKAYLVRKGIAESRIEAIGRGESKFIADNNTASGRRKNRRIELSFHRPE